MMKNTTGLFCHHLIKAFTHLQIQRTINIHTKTIHKQAVSEIEWRQDIPDTEPRSISEQMRFAKILPDVMALGKAASKSENRFDEAKANIRKLKENIEAIPTITKE